MNDCGFALLSFRNQLCRSKVYCRTAGDRQGELHDLLDKLVTKAQKLSDSSVSLYYFRYSLRFNKHISIVTNVGQTRTCGISESEMIVLSRVIIEISSYLPVHAQDESVAPKKSVLKVHSDVSSPTYYSRLLNNVCPCLYSASLYVVKVLRGAPPADTKPEQTASNTGASDVSSPPMCPRATFVFCHLTISRNVIYSFLFRSR